MAKVVVLCLIALLAALVFAVDSGVAQKTSTAVKNHSNWSSYKIIDIHAHIGSFRGFDLSSETLLENMQRHGVRMAFISNIDCAELPGVTKNLDEKTANDKTIEIVQAHPNQLRGVLWVRPDKNNLDLARTFLKRKVKKGSSDSLFVAMKFHPDMNHFNADDKSVDPFLSLCEEFHIPAVFHCGGLDQASSPERIYKAAQRHPRVPVVLYHMGFNTDHKTAIACVKAALKDGTPDLYLETAQCDAKSVLDAIKQVGAERVMFGTDATYFGKKHYAEYADLIDQLHTSLPPVDFAKVVHANAQKLFAIK